MFTICLDVQDDGTFKVYTESPDEAGEGAGQPMGAAPMPGMDMGATPPGATGAPPAQDAGEEANEPGAQTFDTIKEALTAVLAAVKNGGKMVDTGAESRAFSDAVGQTGQQPRGQ